MQKLPSRLVSGALAVLVIGAIELAAPGPATASSVCPPPPTELAGLISPDAAGDSPLTEQFRPVYGVYAEAAASCWAGAEITVTGFVAGPEGLGGVAPFSIEPVWMTSRAHFLSVTNVVDPEAGPVGPFFPVAVPPSLEAAFSALDGHWVRVSGHFDDQVATTCVVTSSDPALGAVPTAEQAIEICRTSFVLTAVEEITLPPTATEPSDRSAGGLPAWVGLLVVAAAGASFGLVLRRAR